MKMSLENYSERNRSRLRVAQTLKTCGSALRRVCPSQRMMMRKALIRKKWIVFSGKQVCNCLPTAVPYSNVSVDELTSYIEGVVKLQEFGTKSPVVIQIAPEAKITLQNLLKSFSNVLLQILQHICTSYPPLLNQPCSHELALPCPGLC